MAWSATDRQIAHYPQWAITGAFHNSPLIGRLVPVFVALCAWFILALVASRHFMGSPSLGLAGLIGIGAAGSQWYLSRALRWSSLLSSVGVIIFLAQPVFRDPGFAPESPIEWIRAFLFPLMLVALTVTGHRLYWIATIATGLLIGMCTSSVASALILVLVGIAMQRVNEGSSSHTPKQRGRDGGPAFVAIHAALLISAALCGRLIMREATLQSAQASAVASIAPTALALVDRQALFTEIAWGSQAGPDMGVASWYCGIMTTCLGLLALWPGRTTMPHLRWCVAAAAGAYYVALWLNLGSDSLHIQVVTLYQDATVRRQASVAGLQWLGLASIALVAWVGLAFLSLLELISRGRKSTFGAVVISVFIAMVGWTLVPASAWSGLEPYAQTLRPSIEIRAALAFMTCIVATGGIQSAIMLCRTRWQKAIAMIGLATLVVVDYSSLTLAMLRG